MKVTISRAEARHNHEALLRLAAGPTRREAGTRRLRHAATDAAVYEALLAHHHWQSGRCFPGYRAIARLARVGLATVSACIDRLRKAGFIRVRRYLIRVAGHGLRWAHAYTLVARPEPDRVPPPPRSEFAAEPARFSRENRRQLGSSRAWPRAIAAMPARSVAEQLAALAPFITAEAVARATGQEGSGRGGRELFGAEQPGQP